MIKKIGGVYIKRNSRPHVFRSILEKEVVKRKSRADPEWVRPFLASPSDGIHERLGRGQGRRGCDGRFADEQSRGSSATRRGRGGHKGRLASDGWCDQELSPLHDGRRLRQRKGNSASQHSVLLSKRQVW